MSLYFSPAQSSDIVVVLKTIVEQKVKIKLLQEDIKETIKGLIEQHKDEITKEEITEWITWMMEPDKKDSKLERLEESQAKFESIMQSRKQYKAASDELDIEDLD